MDYLDLDYYDDKEQIDEIKILLDDYLELLKNNACKEEKKNLINLIKDLLRILKFDTIN